MSSSRALSIVVFATTVTFCPAPAHAAASDQHPPAKPAAAKPADSARTSKAGAKHTQSASHKPAADHKPAATTALPRAATAAELEALSERIQQRVAEVKRTQKAKAAPAAAHRPAPAPAPRVRLEWRPSVSWPQELTDAPASGDAGDRVALTWESTAP